jgi:hypothetical protein
LPDSTPGLILDMPLEGIEHYVKHKLPSTVLPSDAALVAYLDVKITERTNIPGVTPSLARLEQTVKDSKLFAELSEEVKTSLMTRLHRPRGAAACPEGHTYDEPNELLLNESTRLMRDDNEEDASVKRWLENRVRFARSKLKRRHMKQYEKEGRVLFRHLKGMKPRHIAAELDVTANFINNALGALRIKGKQLLALDSEEVKERRQGVREKLAQRRRELNEAILAYMEEYGPQHMTVHNLYIHLHHVLPPTVKPPGMSTIYYILRKDFNLRFRASPPVLTRYLDPAYDEKRQWVSRLLTHFMQQGMVIVSVDESHIRADSFAKRQWRFAPPRVSATALLHGPVRSRGQLDEDEVPEYQPPGRVGTRDRAEELAAKHAGRRKRGRPRSVSSASNRSASQSSQERPPSSVPSTTVRASSASKIISNWVSSGLAHARKMVSVVSTGLTPHTRLETEGPLLLDSEEEEEEKQAIGEGMRQQTVMS